MNAKHLYARPKHLNDILNDEDFMQYLSEIFTTDDNGNEHPEKIVIQIHNNKINVNFEGSANWRDADGKIIYCNKCGNFQVLLFDADGSGSERFCYDCGAEFIQVGDEKVEW